MPVLFSMHEFSQAMLQQRQYHRRRAASDAAASIPATGSSVKEDELTHEEYLALFQTHSTDCIHNVYQVDQVVPRTHPNGQLSTSLPQDVLSLLNLQVQVLHQYLHDNYLLETRIGDALATQALLTIIRALQLTHTKARLLFLTTLPDCCAAAHDFQKLANDMETSWLVDLYETFPLLAKAAEGSDPAAIRLECSQLVTQLSRDAVQAAERCQLFVIRVLHRETNLSRDLFSWEWEDVWTSNQVAQQLVEVVRRHWNNVQMYLGNDDDTGLFLQHKALVELGKACVCFYLRCLVEKASRITQHRRQQRAAAPFQHPQRALLRMQYDIAMLKDFFVQQCPHHTSVRRQLTDELRMLELVHECMSTPDPSSLETFIVVLHKRTGADALVTRYFCGDLMVLMARDANCPQQINATIDGLDADLRMVTTSMQQQRHEQVAVGEPDSLSFVHLDQMLKTMYEDRLVQGALPVCWTCLPKVQPDDDDDDGGPLAVAPQLRALTRHVAEHLQRRKDGLMQPLQKNSRHGGR